MADPDSIALALSELIARRKRAGLDRTDAMFRAEIVLVAMLWHRETGNQAAADRIEAEAVELLRSLRG